MGLSPFLMANNHNAAAQSIRTIESEPTKLPEILLNNDPQPNQSVEPETSVSPQTLTDIDHQYKQDQINGARADARRYREVSKSYTARAAEYRKAAMYVEEEAAQLTDEADIADLKQSVLNRTKLANDAETDAANFAKKAAEKEAEADALEKELNAQKSARSQEQRRRDIEYLNMQQASAMAENAEDQRYHMTLDEALGVWRPMQAGDWPFVIVQEQPGSDIYPNRLEAHTESRVWKGDYEPTRRGDPVRSHQARMRFTYGPKAEEMNPEIPDWAREQLEGKLNWILEVNELGDAVNPYLEVTWFPGEVEWENGEEPKIIGLGNPRKFLMNREYHISIEEASETLVWIELSGPGSKRSRSTSFVTEVSTDSSEKLEIPPSLSGDKVDALLKGQTFTIKARIPAARAKELGDTITVNASTESGETLDLTLFRRTPNGARPVVFSLDKSITIANEGMAEDVEPIFGSMAWIGSKFALKEGNRIRLDVKNKEIVSFKYDGATQSVVVYDKWFDRSIDQHIATATVLALSYEAALNSNDFSILDKSFGAMDRTSVLRAQQRISNYAALMQQEDLLDLHKYYLGEAYLNRGMDGLNLSFQASDPAVFEARNRPLILSTDDDLELLLGNMMMGDSNPVYLTSLVKAYLEVLKGEKAPSAAQRMATRTEWTSDAERLIVAAILQTASEKVEEGMLNVVNDIAYNVPKAFSESLYISFTGRDLKGKKKSELDRDLVISKMIFQALLNVIPEAGFSVAIRNVQLPPMTQMQRLRNSLQRPTGNSRTYSSAIARRAYDTSAQQRQTNNVSDTGIENIPSSLSNEQLNSLKVDITDVPSGGGPLRCSTANPRSLLDGEDLGNLDLTGSGPNSRITAAERSTAQSLYGSSVTIDGDSLPIYASQTAGTCQIHSIVEQIRRSTGEDIAPFELIMQAIELERFDLVFKAARGELDKVKVYRNGRYEMVDRDPDLLNYYKNMHSNSQTRTLGNHIEYINENGFSNLTARHLLRKYGASVATVHPSKNLKTRVKHLVSAMENGYEVRTVLDLSKFVGEADSFHIVKLKGFSRDPANPNIITEIHFHESNLQGRVLTLPASEFESLIVRRTSDGNIYAHSNFEAVKWGDGTTPLTRRAEAAINSSSATNNTNAIPNNSITTRPGTNASPPANNKDLPDVRQVLIDKYPNDDIPPVHVTDIDAWRSIRSDGRLDLADQGASFGSGGKVGVARDGEIAIRVKEGFENNVEWIEHSSGLIARYWPNGIGSGQSYTGFIYTEHLQYLNTVSREWINFPYVAPPVKAPRPAGRIELDMSDLEGLNNFQQ